MRGPGGPSRASSGVPIRTPGAVTAGRRTVLPSQERRRVPGPKTVECHAAGFALTWRGRPPGRVRSKPIKHRARDALGLADLRHALPFRSNQGGRRGTPDFDKPRCREASRPAGPIGPWRPARPRFFFRAMRIFPNTTAHPAPQRNRAAELCPPQPSAKAGCLTSESYLSGHSGARAISAFTRVFDALCERTRLRAEALSGEHKHPNLRRAKARNPEGNTARASGFRVRR